MAETEVQLQSRLQAVRNAAALAERQRVAGLGVKAPAAISQVAPSSTQQTPAMMADNVQLSDGSWVNKETFYKLSEDDQARLRQLGIQGFNNYYARKEADFRANNIQLKDGSWVTKELYGSLGADDKTLLSDVGIEAFNKQKTTEFETFKANNIQLGDNSWIAKTDYDKLPAAWQGEVTSRGAADFQSWLKTAYGGATEYITVNGEIYGTTQSIPNYPYMHSPNIALGADGNRVYVGGQWPDSATSAKMGAEALSVRWPTEVSTFNPVTPLTTSSVSATYEGLPTVLGGVWGKTPEALAAQSLSAGIIKSDIPVAKVGVKVEQLLQKAIAELSPAEKERYQAEVKAIMTAPGETLVEKLASSHKLSAEGQLAFEQTKEYKAIGVDLVSAQTEDGKNIIAVQLKSGELMLKDTFDNLTSEKQKLTAKEGLKSIYAVVKKTGELIDKDSLAELTKSDSVLAGILSEHGYDAYIYAFKTKYITLKATGENMPRADFNKSTPEVQKFLQERGVAVLNSLQSEVQSSLIPYKSGEGYDVASYLRDNGNKPELSSQLVLAGFDKTAVNNAVEFNKQPFAEENKIETVWKKIQQQTNGEFKTFSHLLYPDVSYEARQEQSKFIKEYPKLAAELFNVVSEMRADSSKDVQPLLSLDAFTAEYAAARGVSGVRPFLHNELDKANMRDLAAFKYEQLYGAKQTQLAVGAGILATLWMPGKVAYPEITKEMLTPMEIAMGVAQIALLAAPGVGGAIGQVVSPLAGKLTSIGIQSAAGVVFTAETVKSANEVITKWDTMTLAEQGEAKKNIAISALMDVWVISGVLGELKGIRAISSAKPSAAIEIPKTTKMPSVAIKEIANVKEIGILRSEASPAAEGYTRVYRGEPSPGRSYMTGGKMVSELAGAEKRVSGKWYSADIGEAKAYTAGKGESVLYFVDIPTKELPKFKPTGETAKWAPAEAEHYVLSGKYLKKALVHPDSISLKSLQSKLDKLVTVSPEEAAILRANAPQAVAFESVKGKVATGMGRLEAEKLLKLAKDSGKAYDGMKADIARLENIPLKSNSYARIANETQKAIQLSRITDKALFEKLGILQDITPKELNQLEQLSKLTGRTPMENLELQRLVKLNKTSVEKISEFSMSAKTLARVKQLQRITNKTPAEVVELKGLTEKVSKKLTSAQLQRLKELEGKMSIKQGIKDINQSISDINKAWNAVDKTKVHTPQRLQALKGLDTAKTKLNTILENWNDNISKPRYRTTAAPSSVEVINALENKLSQTKTRQSGAYKTYDEVVSSSAKNEASDYIRELQSEIDDIKSKLAQYTKLISKGEDLPAEAKTYIFKEIPKPKKPEIPWSAKLDYSTFEPISPSSTSPVMKIIKEKAIDPRTGKEITITKEVISQKPRPVAVMEKQLDLGIQVESVTPKVEPLYTVTEKPSIPGAATKVPKITEEVEKLRTEYRKFDELERKDMTDAQIREMAEIKRKLIMKGGLESKPKPLASELRELKTQPVEVKSLKETRDKMKSRLEEIKQRYLVSENKEEKFKLLSEQKKLLTSLINIEDKIRVTEKPVAKVVSKISTATVSKAGTYTGKALTPYEAMREGLYEVNESDVLYAIGFPLSVTSQPLTGFDKELQTGLQAVVGAAVKAYNETLASAATQLQANTQLQMLTQLQLQTQLQNQLKNATEAAIETKLKTLANPKVKTEITTKYKQAIITKLATPIKPRLPVPIIIIPGAGGKGTIELTEKQKQGIVAWKQGFIFWLKWPDKDGHYPKKNTYHSRSPLEGVEYVKGIGSVAKSIIAKYGRIPEDIKFSMGIQDVDISKTPVGKKPKIEFELAHKYKKHHIKYKAQIEPTPSLRGAR